jgi:UDPglucose 6-dehydrogenase
MKITILGHGHLAYITAACMEQFHKVNVDSGKVGNEDLIWVCYDTPVNENGEPCSKSISPALSYILPYAKKGTQVLVSTQVPVGTCSCWQKLYPDLIFSCSPENLRRGHAINDFLNAERIIVGCGMDSSISVMTDLFSPLNRPIIFMSIESAEMVKHALNSFLALSISFINEIAKVCDAVGANSTDVSRGLQSDKRIGDLAYLKPGGPYTNDTLGREVFTLINIDNALGLGLNLIPAIKKSNDAHRNNRQ